MNKWVLGLMMVASLSSAGTMENQKLRQEVLQNWNRVENLVNQPGNVGFDLQEGTLSCVATTSLMEPDLVGACTFEAIGKSDSIDLLIALTVGDSKTFKGPKDYEIRILSKLED